ncbi:MAG: hypothetical protein WC641_03990 [Patescibacteria group bacterium]
MKPLYIVIICLVVAGGSFFGGMQFQKTRGAANVQFQGANAAARCNGTFRAGQAMGRNGQIRAGGFTAGQIISSDDKSLTIKLQDGGSKLVFLAASTTIQKTTDGTVQDLKDGANAVVTGDANADGSVTARSIQLRTDLPNFQTPTPANK